MKRVSNIVMKGLQFEIGGSVSIFNTNKMCGFLFLGQLLTMIVFVCMCVYCAVDVYFIVLSRQLV